MAAGARFAVVFAVALLLTGAANGLVSLDGVNPSASNVISELGDEIVKRMGFHSMEGLKITGFDTKDALMGRSVEYNFEIQVDQNIFPIKLIEDVSHWDALDFPIFQHEGQEGKEEALVESGRDHQGYALPVLAPFQLAGPLELWIQDGNDMRLALPHDVDAGTLKKVILSDGAVVTVTGARSLVLRQPLDLPLPLHSLANISETYRGAVRSNQKPLLSLRIIGPSSLTSSPSLRSSERLKLKRLAPGLVELSAPSVPLVTDDDREGPADSYMFWPLPSLNGSDRSVRAFEMYLEYMLGQKGKERGSFKLLKAEMSARTYLKTEFAVEEGLVEGEVDLSGFAEWMTKPKQRTLYYEVLARMENGKVVPVKVDKLPEPFQIIDTMLPSVATGNVSYNQWQQLHPPQAYFTF